MEKISWHCPFKHKSNLPPVGGTIEELKGPVEKDPSKQEQM